MSIKSHYYRDIKYDGEDPIVHAIEDLEHDVEELQGEIEGLDERLQKVERLIKPCYVIISDSYGEGYIPGGYTTSFIDVIKRLNPDTPIYDNSAGGGAFGRASSDPLAFVNILNALNTVDEPENVTEVIVAGGANEYPYSSEAISNGIQLFASTAKTRFPNAKIRLFSIGWDLSNDVHRNQIFNVYKGIYETAESVIFSGSPWMFLSDKRYMSSDKIHPSALGHEFIGNYISQILNGSYGLGDGISSAFGLTFVGSDVYDGYGIMTRIGETVVLRTIKKYIDVDIPEMVGGSFTKIATLGSADNHYISGVDTTDASTMTSYQWSIVILADSKFHQVSGDLCFARSNGNVELWFRPESITSDGVSYETFTNITRINFSPSTINIPLWRA